MALAGGSTTDWATAARSPSPRAEHYETMFSTPDRFEGVGVAMGGGVSGEIREHGYWGSMLGRIPVVVDRAMVV